MKKTKNISQIIKVVLLSLVLSLGVGYVFAGTPNGVLNVGSGAQTRSGLFDFGGGALFGLNGSANPRSAAYINSSDKYSLPTSPDYTFWGDRDTGISHSDKNVLSLSAGGIPQINISSNLNKVSFRNSVQIKGIAPTDERHGILLNNDNNSYSPTVIGADDAGAYIYNVSTTPLNLGVNSSEDNIVVESNGKIKVKSLAGKGTIHVCANSSGKLIQCQ